MSEFENLWKYAKTIIQEIWSTQGENADIGRNFLLFLEKYCVSTSSDSTYFLIPLSPSFYEKVQLCCSFPKNYDELKITKNC